MSPKKGLGTGLSALFGEDGLAPTQTLPIARVEPREGQPRTQFDETALQELSESIAAHGMLQPITVRPLGGGYYQIIAGERRWRAARLAGLREVPVHIVEADDRKTQELALVENLQREDLNPMEEARGYRALMDDYGLTQDAVSQSVGKSRPAVANALRLLALQPEVMQMLEQGELSSGHARALLPLENRELQIETARRVAEKKLSVRQTEALVSTLLKTPAEKPGPAADAIDYADLMSRQLGQSLGRKVSIVDGRRRGRIVLEYYGADDREELIEALLKLNK